jgi:hypothetical protein
VERLRRGCLDWNTCAGNGGRRRQTAVAVSGKNDSAARRSPATEKTRWRSAASRRKTAALRLGAQRPVREREEGVSGGGRCRHATAVTTRLSGATTAFEQGAALRTGAVGRGEFYPRGERGVRTPPPQSANRGAARGDSVYARRAPPAAVFPFP